MNVETAPLLGDASAAAALQLSHVHMNVETRFCRMS